MGTKNEKEIGYLQLNYILSAIYARKQKRVLLLWPVKNQKSILDKVVTGNTISDQVIYLYLLMSNQMHYYKFCSNFYLTGPGGALNPILGTRVQRLPRRRGAKVYIKL